MIRPSLRAALGLLPIVFATDVLAQQAAATEGKIEPKDLGFAIAVVLVAVVGMWFYSKRSSLLKDNLLPQMAPERQPYSLGRWQMAFWSVLIFVSFLAIWIMRGHYNDIITEQSLWLMGISATTGVFAVAVDVAKDSPADAANRALKALGLQTYDDVERTRDEIADRQKQLGATPPPLNAPQLQLEIHDRQLLLTAYERIIRPFVSEGWYKDLTTDANGSALHRVQTLVWTLTLGMVFIVTVVTHLVAGTEVAKILPHFDNSLLILLGISNAGYIGFKYPEPQQ